MLARSTESNLESPSHLRLHRPTRVETEAFSACRFRLWRPAVPCAGGRTTDVKIGMESGGMVLYAHGLIFWVGGSG